MTDDRVETHVAIADPETPERPAGRALPGVLGAAARRGARPRRCVVVGLDDSTPGPGVIDAITDADLVLLPPTNPVVSASARSSACPACARRWSRPAAPVVGLSPIIGGTHVRGMAAPDAHRDRGRGQRRPASALHYGARSAGGVLDGWLVDSVDERRGRRGCARPGSPARAVPLLMTDPEATAAMAAAAVALVR